jgi:hypothetical protein
VRALLALSLLLGCAQPPLVDGAPCPCGSDEFVCQQGVCVKSPAAPQPGVCADPGPGSPRMLSAVEYRNTILDLLGVDMGSQLPVDVPPVIVDGAQPPPVPQVYQTMAFMVVAMLGDQLPALVGCNPTLTVYECGQRFVDGFGRRAYRHPLGDAERSSLTRFFDADSSNTINGALIGAMVRLLSSPSFIYRMETGEPASNGARVVPLTPWERATRLSYFLWESTPDEQLMAAAQSGALRDSKEIGVQTDRMLRDPRAGRAMAQFHRQWLKLDLSNASDLPASLQASLLGSADAFFSTVAWQQDQPLSTWLTYPYVFGDRLISTFYDLAAPVNDGFEPLATNGGQVRRGLLTNPALLATFAHGPVSAPVLRGWVISEQMLCRPIPLPPAMTPAPPGPTGKLTTRQLYLAHTENPACRACHELFDPIGFGLENYDGYGRWRTEENGQPIDAHGVVLGSAFDGPDGLAHYLSDPDRTPHCVVVQFFRHALGRMEEDVDDCALGTLQAAFLRGGQRLGSLVRAITQNDAFLTRRTARAP